MRVIVVDDQRLFLSLARGILGHSQEFQIVGEALDGTEAVKLADELDPDLVLMDMHMPRMNGLEAAARILQVKPKTIVVLLSMHHDKEYSQLAREVGAIGYLPKQDFDLQTLLHLLAQNAPEERPA